MSIAFTNIKNIKSNFSFAQYLIRNFKINFFSETWLADSENSYLDILRNNGMVLSKNEFYTAPQRGRPFGGLAWFIDSSVNIIEHSFLNSHISYLDCRLNNSYFLIIGCYMPFDDSSKDTYFEYQHLLSLVKELISAYKSKSFYNIIIGGDFNADLYRKKRLDNLLLNFINENGLISDAIYTQSATHTYSNGLYEASLDHILTSPNNNDSNFQINILADVHHTDVVNVSDHNPIIIEFTESKKGKKFGTIESNKHLKKSFLIPPNLLDSSVRSNFSKIVDLFLMTQDFSRLNLTDKYTLLCNALSLAYNKLSSVKSVLHKKADWWSPDLRLIKAKILKLKSRLIPISMIDNNSNHNVIIAIKKGNQTFKKTV